MKTLSLVMLLAVLIVGALAVPAFAVTCEYKNSLSHYVSGYGSDCWIGVTHCGGQEKHWHIQFIQAANWDCTGLQPLVKGVYATGSWWGLNMHSPNKSSSFGSKCLSATTCNRCWNGSVCANSDITARCCVY